MVYLTAAAFEDVSREEAVPGYGLQSGGGGAASGGWWICAARCRKLERRPAPAPEAPAGGRAQVAESLASS